MTSLDIISLAGGVTSLKSGASIIKQLTSKSMSRQTLLQRWKAMIGKLVGTIGTTFSYSASAADGVINSLAIAFIADEQKD